MDEGRIDGTDQVWPADQIWQLGDASAVSWCCIGCNAILTPCAWRPEFNYKIAAHFKARVGHEPDCRAEGVEKLIKEGGRKAIKTVSGLPGPYPASVRFVERHERLAVDDQAVEGVRDTYRPERGGDYGHQPRPEHRRTVTTIRLVCRFYQAFPTLRGLALDIPGCDGRTYFDVFKPLSNNYAGPVDGKICYAGIRFVDVPDYSAEILRISLNLKNIVTIDGATIGNRVYLLVDWREWSPTQKGLFRNHVEEVRQDLGKKYRMAKNKTVFQSANIFFIGGRFSDNEFNADDHRKICLLKA